MPIALSDLHLFQPPPSSPPFLFFHPSSQQPFTFISSPALCLPHPCHSPHSAYLPSASFLRPSPSPSSSHRAYPLLIASASNHIPCPSSLLLLHTISDLHLLFHPSPSPSLTQPLLTLPPSSSPCSHLILSLSSIQAPPSLLTDASVALFLCPRPLTASSSTETSPTFAIPIELTPLPDAHPSPRLHHQSLVKAPLQSPMNKGRIFLHFRPSPIVPNLSSLHLTLSPTLPSCRSFSHPSIGG